ncbi:MAG TPA: Fic family protein [Rhodobacteraceae bacterium]|nr:Fic family protein [Paracoccaceae bacterium]
MTEIWQTSCWPHFTYNEALAAPLLLEIATRQGELTGLQAGLSSAEREEIILQAMTREAVHSFGIEGVKLDLAEVEASVVASMKTRNFKALTQRSDAVAELMLDARSGGTLNVPRLFEWHQLLFHGMEIEDLGVWRGFDLVIAKSARADRDEVLYKPLPHGRVADEMTAFLGWLAEDTSPLPIRAALAHLWFESIHPFSDGNGRIGRAIIELVFSQEAALPFSLSRQIEAEKKAYYAALQAGRVAEGGQINATAFVQWFLNAVLSAGKVAADEVRFLVQRNRYFMEYRRMSARQEMVLRHLFSMGVARVALGVSAKAYSKISGVSAATATRDLVALEGQGALQRSAEGGRSTRYFFSS